MIHSSRENSCKYGRSRMDYSFVICDIHCSKNSDKTYRFTGWVFWYIFILNGESRVSFFLFWHCALPLSLGEFECWDLLKFMKSGIPSTHLKKEDTFIDNENVIEYFIHMYTVDKAGLSHMSRWQSVSLVLWVKRHNLVKNRALQINLPLEKTQEQWCYNELCPVDIKIWPCPQIWSYFNI